MISYCVAPLPYDVHEAPRARTNKLDYARAACLAIAEALGLQSSRCAAQDAASKRRVVQNPQSEFAGSLLFHKE